MKRRSRFVLACFLTVLFHGCLFEMDWAWGRVLYFYCLLIACSKSLYLVVGESICYLNSSLFDHKLGSFHLRYVFLIINYSFYSLVRFKMFYTRFNKHVGAACALLVQTSKEPLRLNSSIFEFKLLDDSDVKLSSVSCSEMDIGNDGHAHSEVLSLLAADRQIVSLSPPPSDDYILLDAAKAADLFPRQNLPVFEADFPVISHDVAVDLLFQLLNSRFCGRSTFNNLHILSVYVDVCNHSQENVSYCYHVELDSYLEKRSISASDPYSVCRYSFL